jgi:predicted ArsR family transcriptional regulator
MTSEDLLMFCYKPRTIHDIAAEFSASTKAVAPRLRKLMAEQRLIRRTTDQGTARMKQWYMTIEATQNPALLATQYSQNVMGVWL